MTDIFKIIDRFDLSTQRTIYMLKMSKGAVLKLGTFLFDLHGNGFKVTGIEMGTRCWERFPLSEEFPIGVLLESASGADVEGTILVKEISPVNILFCNHILYPHRVDPDYEDEYRAAEGHNCALFSYEALADGALKLYGQSISGLTIYRGWMMKPEMYRKLYDALEEKGIYLINTPAEYARYHLLPGWYEDFKDVTAASVWTIGSKKEDVLQAAKTLEGSYIVKDYVKSRKHEWYDACFVKNIQNTSALETVVNNFITRQGEDLTGGIVLRKFEPLKQTGFHEQSGMPLSEEYRVFVYAGKILAIDDYWGGISGSGLNESERRWISAIASRIRSSFVTIDIARRADGTLLVLELGDGQVSGLQQLGADEFYRRLQK